MRMITASVLGLGMAVMAHAANDVTTASSKPAVTISGRAGIVTTDVTSGSAQVSEDKGGFLGGQLNVEFPMSGLLAIQGIGYLDLGYGSGRYHETDFTFAFARFKAQGVMAADLQVDALIISPFAGLGLRYWRFGDPDPYFLHVESWSALYGVVGIRGQIIADRMSLFGQVDIQLPLKETLTVLGYDHDLTSDDETSMVNIEGGLMLDRVTISVFGELFEYKNDSSSVGIGSKISMPAYGLRVGFTF